MEKITRVELGCGSTKNVGYIGIDRFSLPNVDIVADLDLGIPLEDNSVDVIFCSHSLEHFNNLSNIISEIYRVCKHKSIVNILAPYYFETVNFANFYHKQVFNESTFRFFTNDSKNSIDTKDYYNPHASFWGLASSDNSNYEINLHTLNIEYFYFPSFANLNEDEKRNARRSLLNVCDQIYYSLAVNKSRVEFTDEEIYELKEKSKREEVPVIDIIRNREINHMFNSSIVDDVKKWDDNVEERLGQKLNESEKFLSQKLANIEQRLYEKLTHDEQCIYEKLSYSEKCIYERLAHSEQCIHKELVISEQELSLKINKMYNDNTEKIALIEKKYNDKLELISVENTKEVAYLQKQLNNLLLEKNSLTVVVLDLIKSRSKTSFVDRHFPLFRKNHDLFGAISNYTYFTDGLILRNNFFAKGSIVSLSDIIPFESYFEYRLIGQGTKVNFFLFSNIGAKIFLEVVLYGKIVKQESFIVNYEGMYTFILPESILGEGYIRFRTLDNMSICRVLEIVNRKKFIIQSRSLAYFIE